MLINTTAIEQQLRNYIDPYLGQDLVSAKAVKQLILENNTLTLQIVLGFPAAGYQETLIAAIKEQLKTFAIEHWDIQITWKIKSHITQPGIKCLQEVKNIIAIASGKGGVGKSTTAVNLALALAAEGAHVGLLDADIYGPSQPQMLGALQKAHSKSEHTIQPVMSHGIQSMSIGYLIEPDTAMIWRGPMVSSALQQLLNETQWQAIDYLIVDLPPGTGDIQLTLAQKIPVSGAVIVTTPQDIALLDARKAIAMFEKVKIPVMGIVENMSLHTCSQCGHTEHIFGQGGGERLAKQYQLKLLGSLPLDIRIRQQADGGTPTVIAEPQSQISQIYREIARQVAAKLSLQARNFSSKLPTITIEKD